MNARRVILGAVVAVGAGVAVGALQAPLRLEIAVALAAWSVSAWLVPVVAAVWFATRTVTDVQPLWDALVALLVVVAGRWVARRYDETVERRRSVVMVLAFVFAIAVPAQLLVLAQQDVVGEGALPRGVVGIVAMVALGLAVHWRSGRTGRHPLTIALVLLASACSSMVLSAEVLRYRDIENLQLSTVQISRRLQERHNAALDLTAATAGVLEGETMDQRSLEEAITDVVADDMSITVVALADESGTVIASLSRHGTASTEAFSVWIGEEHESPDTGSHGHGVGVTDHSLFVDLPVDGADEPHIIHSVVIDDVELYVAHSIVDMIADASAPVLADTGGAEVALEGPDGVVWVQPAIDADGQPVAIVKSDPELVVRGELVLHDATYQVRLTPSIDFGLPHSTLQVVLVSQGALGVVLYLAVGSTSLVRQSAERQRRRREAMLDAALRAASGWSAIVDRDDVVGVTNDGPGGVAPGQPLAELSLWRDDARMWATVREALSQAREGEATTVDLADRVDGRDRFFEVRVQRIASGDHMCFVQLVDVTEEREQALRTAQAERMESIGLLAGGLAHDFNNLMFISQGYLRKIEDHALEHDDDRLRGFVAPVVDAVRRGSELTRSLLTVSGKHPINPTAVDVDSFVAEMRPLLEQVVPSQIVVEYRLEPGLHLRADAGRLSNALLNLCVNAGHAMEHLPSGHLTVSSRRGADDTVELAVGDTGHGMSAEVRARAFEPFFTTKVRGKGTGLGLASVFSFVQQSAGQITIDSVEGAGTTITLVLPAAIDPATGGTAPSDRARRVLVVDDEEALAELVASWLGELGAEVRVAHSTSEALTALEEMQPDLLLTDANLGSDLDGTDLIAQAQAVLPSLTAVMMTGYSGSSVEGVRTLNKPFGFDQLADLLAAT